MRTIIEVDDDQSAELLEIAAQRGEHGIAAVVREALEAWLFEQSSGQSAVERASKLQGTFSDAEADALEASIRSLREP